MKQGPATDLYAFAAVLYRCVTGRAPLDAADRSLGEEQALAGAAAKGAYGAGLLAAIDAALTPKMEDRPQSVPKLHDMLADNLEGSAWATERKATPLANRPMELSPGVAAKTDEPAEEKTRSTLPAALIAIKAHVPGAFGDFTASLASASICFLPLWTVFAARSRHASEARRRFPLRPRTAMLWAMVPLCFFGVVGQRTGAKP